MSPSAPRRSNEPVFWSLFGAGGVLTALLLPVVILITGILVPLGLVGPEVMSYARVQAFLGSFIGKAIVWGLISLTLWHTGHRIYHGLHDLGVHSHLGLYKWLAYGGAFLGTLVTAFLVLRVGAS
jgi:fumarate reductase subunit D